MNTQTAIRRRPKMYRFLPADTSWSALPAGTHTDTADLLPALAHEVRNPLCTMDLALEMLSLTDLDDERKEFVDIIKRGSHRIKELVNNILVSVRVDAPLVELYSPHQLLEEALITVKDRLHLRNIIVNKEYSEIRCRIRVNKEKIKIALNNIIINAIDAMPLQGGELTLVTKLTGERCTLEIRDNGIGISEECLENIFKPYFTGKEGGMGLGLSITLDILRANHATLDVRSREGAGTCFMLSFENIRQPV
jgi:signal transduction histidine kinase